MLRLLAKRRSIASTGAIAMPKNAAEIDRSVPNRHVLASLARWNGGARRHYRFSKRVLAVGSAGFERVVLHTEEWPPERKTFQAGETLEMSLDDAEKIARLLLAKVADLRERLAKRARDAACRDHLFVQGICVRCGVEQ